MMDKLLKWIAKGEGGGRLVNLTIVRLHGGKKITIFTFKQLIVLKTLWFKTNCIWNTKYVRDCVCEGVLCFRLISL